MLSLDFLLLTFYLVPLTLYHLPITIYQLPTSSFSKSKGIKEIRAENHRKSMGLIAAVIRRWSDSSFNHSTKSLGGHTLPARGKPYAVLLLQPCSHMQMDEIVVRCAASVPHCGHIRSFLYTILTHNAALCNHCARSGDLRAGLLAHRVTQCLIGCQLQNPVVPLEMRSKDGHQRLHTCVTISRFLP